MTDGVRLIDLGERRIIDELLATRYSQVQNFGDDVATLLTGLDGAGALVATTDPCPPPMAESLGITDQYNAGWLLATLNLSDLAASGAEPIGLVTSLVLPADMPVSDFERLLDGIDSCCEAVGTRVVGGNLKEGKTRELTATAVGLCRDRAPLRRSGGCPGDEVVVLGDLGLFWAAVLAVREGITEVNSGDPLLRNVLTPLPKNRLMAAVAAEGLAKASIDNSDGMYPSLLQLAASSRCAVHLSGERFHFDTSVTAIADELKIDPVRLALGWGDWHVIVACEPTLVGRLFELARANRVPACAIGALVDGQGVSLHHNGESGSLMPLDSQRFTRDSWFSAGLETYVTTLLTAPLID